MAMRSGESDIQISALT